MIILYSNNCPQCKVLEAKLTQKNIPYTKVIDTKIMLEKGMNQVPNLEVNGALMNFGTAIQWINSWEA